MRSETPTALEISPTNGLDLDEKEAVAHFLGKSVLEAEALFRDNFVHYSNDLHWMGPVAFGYYFPAFANYLRSAESAGYGDAVNSLIVLLEIRMTNDAASLVSVKEELLGCLDYCIGNYSKFEVSADVYGDLKSKLAELKARLR
ncbi:MAG: hypothetical protein ACREH8_07190 [Opitutaceae bacterium]